MKGATFHAIVLHPEAPRALLLETASGWALPSMVPDDPFFTSVGQLNRALAALGLETTVLRCVERKKDAETSTTQAIFALELRREDAAPGGAWFDAEAVEGLELARPEQREAILRCLREEAGGALPALRPPWARRGWFSVAEAWVHERLAELERPAVGPLEQVKSWSITSLSRQNTSAGSVYFKAVPPLFANEGRIIEALAALAPERVPVLLAAEHARGWLLLEDFGGTLLRELDPGHWEEALKRFAELQIASIGRVETLLQAGCADRRLSVLEAQLPSLLFEAEELSRLDERELSRLRAAEPKLREMLDRLADYQVPETLVHGDLHFGNVALGEHLVFFDWTDGAVAHPFFDLLTVQLFEDRVRDDPTLWRRLQDSYLEPWTAYEPLPRLQEALELALVLAHAYHAVSYNIIRESQEEGARWELEGVTAYLLKRLAEGGVV